VLYLRVPRLSKTSRWLVSTGASRGSSTSLRGSSFSFLMVWTASPQRHHSAKAWSPERHKEGRPPARKFIRIGVDLAKNYFQIHALSGEDSPPVKRLPDQCIVASEAQICPKQVSSVKGPTLLSKMLDRRRGS
jgi:transposase